MRLWREGHGGLTWASLSAILKVGLSLTTTSGNEGGADWGECVRVEGGGELLNSYGVLIEGKELD
jgi:hypothetical protein